MAATATYRYVAVDRATGQRVEGKMRAVSDRAVESSLEASGMLVGPVTKASGAEDVVAQLNDLFASGDGPKVKTVDLALITKQLEVLLRSGLSPAEALDAAVDAAPNEKFGQLLRELADRVRQGMTFPEAIAQYRTFSESYKAWTASAHETGRLDAAMGDLYSQLRQQARIQAEIKSATAYPKWSLVASLLLTAGMIRWLVPQFSAMLAQFGGELPALTRALMALNDNFGWLVAGGLGTAVAIVVFRRKIADDLLLGAKVDQALYRMPVFGSLLHRQVMFRWCSTVAGLLRAGVHLERTLDIAGRASGSRWLRSETPELTRKILDGQPLHRAIEPVQVLTPMVVGLVATGERTGRTDEMLDAAADAQAQQIEATIGALGKKIETVSMLGVIAIIGAIVAAMWLPMLQLTASAADAMGG